MANSGHLVVEQYFFSSELTNLFDGVISRVSNLLVLQVKYSVRWRKKKREYFSGISKVKSRISGLFYLLRLKKKERGGEREEYFSGVFAPRF